MCNALGVTQEHVPPRSFFPKSDELLHGEVLGNLITVPSCKAHNNDKSTNDQLFLLILHIASGNRDNRKFIEGRMSRSIKRRPKAFENIIKRSNFDQRTASLATRIDGKRWDQYLDSMGLALYYHCNSFRHIGLVQSIPHFLNRDDSHSYEFYQIRNMLENIDANIEFQGENKKYFSWREIYADKKMQIIEAKFYNEFIIHWIFTT